MPVITPALRAVWRFAGGRLRAAAEDELAGEEPLEIRVRGRAVSLTMRTPGSADDRASHDAELALGFLLSEGIVRHADDVLAVEPCQRPANTEGNIVNVFLSADCRFDPDQLTRHVFASSSCGLCGRASIDAIHQHFDPVYSKATVTTGTLLGLPEQLHRAQPGFKRTGGLHAAALFHSDGRLLVLREDIGRHNAVDKVLGHALRAGWLPLADHVLMVSGRVSFEIVQKALSAGVPVVAAVSAPSSLAVETAEASGITLVGFLRDVRFNVYCHPGRIADA